MPACECYAALVVVSRVTHCKRLVTDCLSNVLLTREGGAKAKGGAHPYARVWRSFFAAVDGWSPDGLASAYVWMPSHKSAPTFSSFSKSNGVAVTFLDWLGNRAADKLAELAALSHRVPFAERLRRSQVTEALRFGLAKAGRVTYLSQNAEVADPDGFRLLRDSAGRPTGGPSRKAPGQRRTRASAPRPPVTASALQETAAGPTPAHTSRASPSGGSFVPSGALASRATLPRCARAAGRAVSARFESLRRKANLQAERLALAPLPAHVPPPAAPCRAHGIRVTLPGAWPRLGLEEARVAVRKRASEGSGWVLVAVRLVLDDPEGNNCSAQCDLLQAALEDTDFVLPLPGDALDSAQVRALRAALARRALTRVRDLQRASAAARSAACPVHGRSRRRVRLSGKHCCSCRLPGCGAPAAAHRG